jgi:hypothetical protein
MDYMTLKSIILPIAFLLAIVTLAMMNKIAGQDLMVLLSAVGGYVLRESTSFSQKEFDLKKLNGGNQNNV